MKKIQKRFVFIFLVSVIIFLLFYFTNFNHATKSSSVTMQSADKNSLVYSYYLRHDYDNGEDIGTIFTIKDKSNTFDLLGAGFENGVNTFMRTNNRVVSFYVNYKTVNALKGKKRKDISLPKTIDLGKPFPDLFSVDLMSYDNQLIAIAHNPIQSLDDKKTPNPRYYDFETKKWETYNNPLGNELKNIVSSTLGPLFLGINKVFLKDQLIIETPQSGYFIYTNNNLFFVESGKKIYQCPWQVSHRKIDMNSCNVFQLASTDRALYAYTTQKDRVLFWFNNGNSYEFSLNKPALKILNDRSVNIISNQIYATNKYEGSTLLGQYPLGSLLEMKDNVISPFQPTIPYTKNQSKLLPEAQTIATYLGEIYVGTWPWGMLWKFDKITNQWRHVFRAFSEPDTNDIPYYQTVKKITDKAGVRDVWGQRIQSAVNVNHRLYLSTSKKSSVKLRVDFRLSEQVESQYGRVWGLQMPYQITCQLNPANSYYLDFILSSNKMIIMQNGEILCSQKIAGGMLLKYLQHNNGKATIKTGPYGNFSGLLLEKMWRPFHY